MIEPSRARPGLPGKGVLVIKLRELPVVELGRERQRPPGLLRNLHAVVHRVRGARRNRADIERAARLPGVALVDRVAFSIEQERTVKMRPRLHSPVLLKRPGPENRLPGGVLTLQLEPDIKRVNRAAREEVANLARPHHHVEPYGLPRSKRRAGLIQRRRQFANLPNHRRSPRLGLLAHHVQRRRHRRLGTPAPHLRPAIVLHRRGGKNVHRDKARGQKLPRGVQLLLILVDVRHRHVRPREPVVMNLAVPGARVFRIHQRHVAIGTGGGLGRVVEAPGPLAGNPRSLPVIVVVEAADPPVVVHRNIEMHLVAGRTELGRILLHERLQKGAAVGLRVKIGEEVIERPDVAVPARRQLMERRILDREAAVAHRTFHRRNRVARDTPEPVLRLGGVNLILDRLIEAPVEEDGVVVAARAPLTAPRPAQLLHVLNRLPVVLVVEAGEVVHRAIPLLVGVHVALAAQLRIHEEVRGNRAAHVGLGRTRPERTLRAAPFLLHRHRNHLRVQNPLHRLRRQRRQQQRHRRHGRIAQQMLPEVIDRPERGHRPQRHVRP